MIGYKVVSRLNGEYYSATNCGRRTQYYVGEWTEPHAHSGALAVFRIRGAAVDFAKAMLDVAIFRCEYKITNTPRLYWGMPIRGGRKTLVLRSIKLEECPHGTVFASRVKLLEEINYD